MIYLELLWVFIQVGLFSIGGGYAAIPIIQSHVVEAKGWLTMTDFTDLITIAEMTPGPIAINSATFVGIQVAGIAGGIIATIGCIIPSAIIVSLLAFLYFRFRSLSFVKDTLAILRPAIVALIASAGIGILILSFWGEGGFTTDVTALNIVSVIIFFSAMFVLRKYKTNPIFVMLGSGVLGAVFYLLL